MTSRTESRWRFAAFVVPALLAGAGWSLYGSAARLWWTNDDFYVLHVVHGKSLGQAFLSPSVWRQSRMFTPLLLLSFDLDLRAFGLRPAPFYVHQVIAVAGAAVALYAVLRLWLTVDLSFLASVLFLLGAPTGAWAQELLVRHYAEGFILAGLATLLFVLSLRRGRPALSLGSAVFYFGAMLEKEIYVPLALLFVVLPEGTARLRLRRLVPHAAAVAAYLANRWSALGTVMGGYGWTVNDWELPGVLGVVPGKVANALAGGGPWWALLLAATLAIGIAAGLRRGWTAAGLFVLALVLAVAPAIPVSKAFQPRYAGLAWVAIVAAFAFGCRALLERGRAGRRVAIGLAVFALASSLAVNRAAWGTRYAAAERMSIEARSFLEMRDGDFLRQPRIPAAAMNELRWLKEDALGLPRGARWFADDLFLCEHSERVSRMFEYRDATRRVSEATADLRRTSAAYCGSIREAALEADLAWRDGDFSWQLGPYADGRWSIVYGDGVERFDVAPRDGYRHHASVFNLRIRYESPQGWLTFSPNIPLDFRASPRVHWKREARSES